MKMEQEAGLARAAIDLASRGRIVAAGQDVVVGSGSDGQRWRRRIQQPIVRRVLRVAGSGGVKRGGRGSDRRRSRSGRRDS